MKLDWGKSIFLFFVVFITLAIIFIVFSFKHKPDLVTDDYYEKGAAYTQQINTNKRSVIFQDSVDITQNSDFIIIRFAKGISDEVDSLNIHFYCPADKQNDYNLSITDLRDTLALSRSQLVHGRYFVKIYWQMKNENYYLEKDLFVQ